jgi:hypothetical protein
LCLSDIGLIDQLGLVAIVALVDLFDLFDLIGWFE